MGYSKRRASSREKDTDYLIDDIRSKPTIVGYAFMPKKMESMEKIIGTLTRFHDDVIYKPLDFTRELQEQGRFDVILHKLSEDIMNRSSNSSSAAKLARIDRYMALNTSCVCVDPLENVENVINRVRTLDVLQDAYSRLGAYSGMPRPPRFLVISAGVGVNEVKRKIRDAQFQFPLICKPIQACGTLGSHTMLVILDEGSLSVVSVPIVIQEYYNHNSTLFKVCVVGDEVQMHSRPSLPNLPSNLQGSLSFDSQKPYPTVQDFGGNFDPLPHIIPPQLPLSAALKAAQHLRDAFSLTLFGFDLIVSCETKEIVIIDVNYFPSFRDFPEFPTALSGVLRKYSLVAREEESLRSDVHSSASVNAAVSYLNGYS